MLLKSSTVAPPEIDNAVHLGYQAGVRVYPLRPCGVGNTVLCLRVARPELQNLI